MRRNFQHLGDIMTTSKLASAAVDTASTGVRLRFRRLVTIASVAILVLGLTISVASLLVSNAFKQTGEHSLTMVQALRHHLTADMYHDSMRGVVYKALYASSERDGTLTQEAMSEVVEYGAAFRAEFAGQDALDLSAEVRTALDHVKGPLDEYINGAQAIVDFASAGNMARATAALPAFSEQFSVLEVSMSETSDAIQAAILSDQKSAEDVSY